MRINIHDYSGHLFQSQLSRALAARGHEVVHGSSAQWVTGHGRLARADGDPSTLTFLQTHAGCELAKYDPVGRARFELNYARAWQRQLVSDCFDVVVACNVPLLTLNSMRTFFHTRRQPWVLWHQDIYSLAIAAEAARTLPRPVAAAVSRAAKRMEMKQVVESHQVVAIGPAFRSKYAEWGLRTSHVQIIPNWAPLDDVRPGPRDNAWSRRHGLPSGGLRLLYAGTLGRKHNSLLLLQVLDAARARGVDATLVVCSEGAGVDELRAAAQGRSDVRILGFQPIEVFSDVLASADVMLAVLEPAAAAFSIPSKIFSHMSAGRPTLALVPDSNPSARDVVVAGGFVAGPTSTGAAAAGEWLASMTADDAALARLGRAARAFAEQCFDIRRTADRFETLLVNAAGARRSPMSLLPREVSTRQFDIAGSLP